LTVLAALSVALADELAVEVALLASESVAVRVSVGLVPTSFLLIVSLAVTVSPDTTLPGSLLILSLEVKVSDRALLKSNAVASTTVTGSGSISASLMSKSTDEWNILLIVESAVTELTNDLVTLTVKASAMAAVSDKGLVIVKLLIKSAIDTVCSLSTSSGTINAVALIDVAGAAVKPIKSSTLFVTAAILDTEAEANISDVTAAVNFIFTRSFL
jgi:hypothetical protein